MSRSITTVYDWERHQKFDINTFSALCQITLIISKVPKMKNVTIKGGNKMSSMLIAQNFRFLTWKMNKLWLIPQDWLFQNIISNKLAIKSTKNIIFIYKWCIKRGSWSLFYIYELYYCSLEGYLSIKLKKLLLANPLR